MNFEQQINLSDYPIEDPGNPRARRLVDRCQAQLNERGAYVLEGFLRDKALYTILGELNGVLDKAFNKSKSHNAYLAPSDDNFSGQHPGNRQQLTTSATLAYDFIAGDSLLESIYRWPPLRDFIAQTLGLGELYPYSDELAAINVLIYPPGTMTGWHFDNAHFVVTLMLRQAQRGGAYEFAPFIRGPEAENFSAIESVLDEQSLSVRRLEQRAGDLVVFKGRYTLHRVTEVGGTEARLVAVLSYDAQPGKMLSPHTQMTFYGRSRQGTLPDGRIRTGSKA